MRRVLPIVAAALATAVLAGCGSAHAPRAVGASTTRTRAAESSTSIRVTPIPTPSASMAGPALPAAARAHTPEGARAFAAFYVDMINAQYTTPDPMLTIRHDGPGCIGCSRLREQAMALKAAGKHLDRPLFVDAVVEEVTPDRQDVLVDVRFRQAPAHVIRPDGSLGAPSPERRMTFRFTLAWDDGWYVLYLQELPGTTPRSAGATETGTS